MTTRRYQFLLLTEFVGLFVIAPLIMALFLPPSSIFTGLFLLTGVGLALLVLTPGFDWRALIRGAGHISWGGVVLFLCLTAASSTIVLAFSAPEAIFGILRSNPTLLLMIAILYPLVSALPQELIYRVLFFQRYATILPKRLWPLLTLNAALFSFAHLLYWSWVVAIMTFFGGLAFAYSAHVRRNFPEALILHGLSGIVLFAMGMGVYFYSGNVTRPF